MKKWIKVFALVVMASEDEEEMKDLCFKIEQFLSKGEFSRSVFYKIEGERNKERLKYIIDDPDSFKEF